MVEPLDIGAGNRLSWSQPKALQRTFELRDGNRLFGTLSFVKSFGSLAEASMAAGDWTLKRVGYFRPSVTVRRRGQEADLAVYEPRGWGAEGELQFAGGRIYAWKPANFWATKFNFVDTAGRPLVAFKPGAEESKWSDLFKFQALVEIEPSANRLEELPLLVSVGWYLMILHHEDASSAGAVVATMG
jgi:hypothetical protein